MLGLEVRYCVLCVQGVVGCTLGWVLIVGNWILGVFFMFSMGEIINKVLLCTGLLVLKALFFGYDCMVFG